MEPKFDNVRIITVAPVGAWPTKKENPNVPLTPEEVAEEVYQCWKEGAAVAHIHVRDKDGKPCMDFDRFCETVERIRAHKDCDIILNLTSAGASNVPDEDRIRHIEALKPEIASFDCGTMNWQHSFIADNSPQFLEKLGLRLQKANVVPEIEIFDSGMIFEALYYLKTGVLKAPLHFQFCLGVPGGMPASVENLLFMLSKIPEGSTWSAFGVGKMSMPITLATIALGGQLRVGMEDNVMISKGVLAESNMQLVRRAKDLLEAAGCRAATPAEARKILSLD
ncbi:MAG: 3-keto-5-aminohexanoate cleavage protein [Lachnospiraceae bacterium]|nr:3-keto-5-aminohexanoate cleavage protein [Lachnospiraceae bacterium]